MPIPDTCIITASDERQAAVFKTLLQRRISKRLYPRELDFRVYPDPPAGRVGSGGGTIWAVVSMLRDEGLDLTAGGAENGLEEALSRLSARRILVIHAGGESRRLPCYVPEGKIFAPIPVPSSSLTPPVVLDVEFSLFLKYPWRNGELLATSGDALVDFNTDLLNLPDAPLCGFSAPESFDVGSRHGVFAFDPITGVVRDYHQKASPDFLAREARIEGTESCAVDLGPVSFRGQGLRALLGSAIEPLPGGSIIERIARGELALDVYLEILTACLQNLDRPSYLKRLAGKTTAAKDVLDLLYERFHPCGLSGAVARQTSFIHFGSVAEFPAACRELLTRGLAPFYSLAHEELVSEVGESIVRFNSLDATISREAAGVCVENCRNTTVSCEGDNLLVGLRNLVISDTVPRGFCLEERRLFDQSNAVTLRLVYHKDDSFKPQKDRESVVFCGKPLRDWLAERHLTFNEVFPPGAAPDLFLADLFPAEAGPEQLAGYLRAPRPSAAWLKWFRSSRRYSISSANASTDAVSRDEERENVRGRELSRRLRAGGFFAVPALDFADLVADGLETADLVKRCSATDDPLLKGYRSAVLRAAHVNGAPSVDRVEVPFAVRAAGRLLRCTVKLDQIVWARAPVRLDLAGGWTDTPPYTNRFGGAVLNVAVDLNGQSPIQVFVRRTPEPQLTLHSIDLGVTEIVRDVADLRSYKDPSSPFSLPRAALVLLGLGSGQADDEPLTPAFARAGGGMELTLLCAVPKGSGLGTSSVLAGTILAALERFYDLPAPRDELFLQVLEVEQMLTTGGGWQDQIGGLVGGIKYIESRPAMKPRPVVHQLDPWIFEAGECTERMTLFYTGVTRLAKRILKEVVDRVNGLERSYLFTHNRIAELAREGRDAVSRRDVGQLSHVISESFRENKLIHGSTTNNEIDAVIDATASSFNGMKLLGAGGGGFALFISPDAARARSLRSLLSERFENERARLVDFSLNKKGLEVTVS
jgi:galactokinase/mevalonate kinase-like predicted kinase